jgi:hypothetical protein
MSEAVGMLSCTRSGAKAGPILIMPAAKGVILYMLFAKTTFLQVVRR